jgi:2-keto-myo-inositol isomerase
MLSRRLVLVAPLAQAATRAAVPSGKMTLCMHQNTSAGAGYRKSLEGWSRAGIKLAELTAPLLDGFLKTDDLAAARRVLSDLGLTAVSCGSVLGIWEPSPNRAASLDTLKKRCEMFSSLGIDRMVCPCSTTQKITEDDYKTGVDNMREVGEIARQYKMTAMVEFTRGASFIGTLSTSLKMTREAAHPNVRPMLDCYHFWAGVSKFEDLDLIRNGEIAHVHFQDVPDMPRELLGQTTRAIPSDGITPLARILRKLSEKGYSGPVSVELFLPEFQNTDPYELARRIREKAEPVMRQAGVLS